MIKNLKLYKATTCKDTVNAVLIAKEMKENNARYVYIVDKGDKPIGVVSAIDLCNKVIAREMDAKKVKASDIMNTPVDHVDINQETEYAMKIMIQHKSYSCLVTENGKVKGVVDYNSVLENIMKKIRGK